METCDPGLKRKKVKGDFDIRLLGSLSKENAPRVSSDFWRKKKRDVVPRRLYIHGNTVSLLGVLFLRRPQSDSGRKVENLRGLFNILI